MYAVAQDNSANSPVTDHARCRMAQRGVRPDAVAATLRYGRCVHVRGAWVSVIGRREVAAARRTGIDLSRFEGLHVVSAADGSNVAQFPYPVYPPGGPGTREK